MHNKNPLQESYGDQTKNSYHHRGGKANTRNVINTTPPSPVPKDPRSKNQSMTRPPMGYKG